MTFQYADDTNIYKSCRPSYLAQSTESMNTILKASSSWSPVSHLALNSDQDKIYAALY